jgi:putative ATPase
MPLLADQQRPGSLKEFHGQDHLISVGMPLRFILDGGVVHSMVLWGPPGSGKTSFARILARRRDLDFNELSAVFSGVKEIRVAIKRAMSAAKDGRIGILFVDEVHRFNKAQQDAFLPHVEDGTIILVGATTENPSYELNNALLSRMRVYKFEPLDREALNAILNQTLDGTGGRFLNSQHISSGLRNRLFDAADGDARRLLNIVEQALAMGEGKEFQEADLRSALEGVQVRRFDKAGDDFYSMISALHKSIRGSNPDAALYWFARLVDGGCDIGYVARRLTRIASEDIGNADPRALNLTSAAWEAWIKMGTPEGELAVAQAVIYCAVAPKSNAVYRAYSQAVADVKKYGSAAVPPHIRNAVTNLDKSQGYGAEYVYDHDTPDGFSKGQTYFPERIGEKIYYEPVGRGLEIKIKEKLARLRNRD